MSHLRSMREAADLTQAELAEAAGVDRRTITRWEAQRTPQQRVLLLYQSILQPKPQGDTMSPTSPQPLADVIEQRPDPLPIRGILSPLLGSLPQNRPFSILLGGASGAGKSSVALMLAAALAQHSSVLYSTAEERLDSGTFSVRAEHVGIEDADVDIVEVQTLDEVDTHLHEGDYSFCVIDSLNEVGAEPNDIISLMSSHRGVSWVLIAQADAAEKATRGGARWRHLVDIRLWCEIDKDGKRVVRNLKNRFGPEKDHIVLSKGKTKGPASSHTTIVEPKQGDPDMSEYRDWIIQRLEAEVDEQKQEIKTLRDALAQRDLQLQDAQLRLLRQDILNELTEQESPSTLSDRIDPAAWASIAEKVAPFAAVLGDLFKSLVLRAPAAAQAEALATNATPPPMAQQYVVASPYDDVPVQMQRQVTP